ncbi:uncharacterized protein LOC106011828 [Aplysia californica]|uniref:Uncharacterized protein LOC106011828 n=1 Tax=Aplysia californica TaxID=6500 RepID=A0ABM1A0F0_APLCA|nr:uncharacterized protein LOC106011828 [Aplysia californica]
MNEEEVEDCKMVGTGNEMPALAEVEGKPDTMHESGDSLGQHGGGDRHNYLVKVDRYSNWPIVEKAANELQGLISSLRRTFATYGISDELSSDGGLEFTSLATRTFLRDWGLSTTSKYAEVTELKQKTTLAVITGLKPILARHGTPEQVIADNNSFGSLEMEEFAKSWNFRIITSSPRYPQPNGQAERFLRIFKDILKKAKDPNAALLAYRNTPVTGLDYSPAEMLMGRRLSDLVPAGLNPTSKQNDMKEKLK